MDMLSALGLAALCATASAATPGQLGTTAVSRLQELNLEQVRCVTRPHLPCGPAVHLLDN